jgi:two-component system sensor histidine kinase/response regulator
MGFQRIHEMSLRQRLLLLTMVTSGVGVLLGCIGFLAYDMHVARQQKVEELRSTGDLIGKNSAAALEFGDEIAGAKLLESLSTRPQIRVGILYRRDGGHIASYVRAELSRNILLSDRPPQGVVWAKDRLTYCSTVFLGRRPVGSLYLESGLADLQERLWRFEQLTALIAMGSLLLVYLLTAALQRGITRPIQNLAAIARSVATEKSYSLRAPPLSGRELRQLGTDFNHMLDEIKRRDAALNEARDVLELRVAARTGELEMEVKERSRAEQELQQRTTFLNTLIIDNPLAIAVGGPDGRLQLVNPAFEKLFGYTSDEAIGLRVDELLYPSSLSRDEMEGRLKRVKKETVHETVRRRKKSGDLVDVEVHAVPLLLEGGEQNVLALYQDISQRVAAEKALRESEELFRTVSNAAPVGIFLCDAEGSAIYANEWLIEKTGLSREQVAGTGFLSCIYPDDREQVIEAWGKALQQEGIYRHSHRMMSPTGTVSLVEANFRVLRSEDGIVKGFVGVVQDVTEQRSAEERLRQSEELFRMLSATAPVGIVLVDEIGNLTYVNEHYLRITGLKAESAHGSAWKTVIHPEDLHRICEIREKAIAENKDYAMSYRYLHRNGDVVWADTVAKRFTQKDGAKQGYVVVVQDVTERHNAEVRLRDAKEVAEAASRAKSEFMANMSHEIRTPMNGILGMTDLALDTELNPEQREYLEMVRSSAESLLGIINDILDFSKIEAGRLDLESLSFTLLDCIESALEPLAVRAQQKGLEVNWALEGDIPEVLMGDPTRLRQILINLAGNAIKFTKEGEVSVRAQRLPSKEGFIPIRFSVSDTGMGIPKEKQQQIFDAFSQADSSTTREFGGTGLGLSISSRLIQLMRGEIGLESTPGKGSTFTFTVPFLIGTAAAPALLAVAPPAMVNKRVLIADDNEVNRILLMQVLPQWGLQPACAVNGREALEIFRKSVEEGAPFSVVLLDQNMPGMDGYKVSEGIRLLAKNEQPAIVILSSAPSLADPDRLKKLGIERHLIKPLRRAALYEAICHGLKLPAPSEKTPITGNDLGKTSELRLLLVEDNRVNQKLALRLLEKMGHQVTLAINGQEAIELLQPDSFDLVLMDIQMPVMGGVEATQKIRDAERKTGRHVPIIAMTAHAMSGDAEKYLSAGMDGYISKPVRAGFLRAEIERLARPAHAETRGPTREREKYMPTAIIDLTELLARVENDRELMRDLLLIFKEEFPRHLQALRDAVDSMDGEKVAAVAHSLKGMLSNLAAGPAAAAAARLEQLGRNREVSDFREACASFENISKELLLQLDTCMAEVCG